MGKFSLGTATTPIDSKMNKDNLYLDVDKAKPLEEDMLKQLATISTTLSNINSCLNKAVSKKVVTGSYAKILTGWAKKAKTQSSNAQKRRTSLKTKYEQDSGNYTIKLLSDKLASLEAQIEKMAAE